MSIPAVFAVPDQLAARVADQFWVVTLGQCLQEGLTRKAVDWRVHSGRWQRMHRGVFLVRPGPVSLPTRAMAAVLMGGMGSAVSHATAGALYGLVPEPGPLVHLAVDQGRRLGCHPGVMVHRVTRLDEWIHPTGWPPRTTIERTVLDLADVGTLDSAIAVVASACQRYLTTPTALAAALPRRRGQRWGRELRDVLEDVAAGAQSTMEVRYVRDVERAHRLPTAQRQVATDHGRRRHHDNGYAEQRLLVELDGRLGHHGWANRREDARRDRHVGAEGWLTVRAGWAEVAGAPCVLAQEIADVLRARGWGGRPRRCRRAGCRVR
ncbi:MAG: type IV toxin-antitoxin system AbiEi family antitoxin domain-containing protein [Dermatophilaceae bacterium]